LCEIHQLPTGSSRYRWRRQTSNQRISRPSPGRRDRAFKTENLVSPPFTDLGVSIYLYRVAYNATWSKLPPRRHLNGDRFKRSMPLDLYFLVTAWARTPEQQWALLAWAIRMIDDTPVLPVGLLNQSAGSDPDGTPQNVFGEDESVELVGENLSLQDTVSISEIAKHNQNIALTRPHPFGHFSTVRATKYLTSNR
jgi:hypothetical protein